MTAPVVMLVLRARHECVADVNIHLFAGMRHRGKESDAREREAVSGRDPFCAKLP